MKNFSHFGVKKRVFPEQNYHAIWYNLKTLRLGTGVATELPPNKAEFYDIALGTKCNLECPFCYANANKEGRFFENICDKAERFFGPMSLNDKPFQVAIGSSGEPTIHPEFIDFLKTIYALGIVPNYTTNGITLANNNSALLTATEKYCGGVALSANYWNRHIDEQWRKAFMRLSDIDININVHYIISDKKSVDYFMQTVYPLVDRVMYFVLLPIMPQKCSNEVFEYLLQQNIDWSKVAFGAHFYDQLQEQDKIKLWMYPPESFSKNLILDDPITITRSSFNKEVLYTVK